MKKSFLRVGGFTLIELIIAMAIMAALVAMVVPSFRSAGDKAKVTARTSMVNSVASVLKIEQAFTGKLPRQADNLNTLLVNNDAQVPDDFECGVFVLFSNSETYDDFIVATAGINGEGANGGPWIYAATNEERMSMEDSGSSSCDSAPSGATTVIKLN